MQRTIILLLIVSLLLTGVSAQDYTAFGDTTINAVPCGTATGSVTIQNNGVEQATYSLSVDGDGSDYITFSLLSFVLGPGQFATIDTFYDVPCALKPGIYQINIYFDDGVTELELNQELNVAIPDNIDVTTEQSSAVIAPCETAGYTFDLHNPLNFTEIYTITASGHSNVHVSESVAVLQNDERKDIAVSVIPEDCAESGIFSLTVTFDTEKSNQHEELSLELIIKSTDVPVLADGISTIRTDYVDSTADLSIKNTGDRVTQYSLSLDGVSWASLSPQTISLSPGESRIIALRLTPTAEVAAGRYPVLFTATVEQTGIRYSKAFTIKLQPPTFFEKNPIAVIGIGVGILAILAALFYLVRYLRSPAFKEKMRKRREKKEARKRAKEQRKAEALKKKLEQQRKALALREKEKARLKKQAEKELKKQYHIVARKGLTVGRKESKKLKYLALGLGVIILLLIVTAWSLILPNLSYVFAGLAILVVIGLAKKLSRNTVVSAQWRIFLAKKTITVTIWKKGLNLLSITASEPIKELKLLVRKIKARVAPSSAVYQVFHIKTNTSDDFVRYRATFSVSKKWLARKHIPLDDVKLARYSNQRWSTIPTKKTGESEHFITFAADLTKSGTYSIYGRPRKQPIQQRNRLVWGAVGIALLIAIAIVLSPQPTTLSRGIPAQIWEQDTVHQVNLNKYFQDPDGDQLEYLVSETEHVDIEFSGNTAFFTPETGWTGEERIVIRAYDGKGGEIDSNTIVLRVQERAVPAHVQPYIGIVLALLTIILLLWIARSQQKRQVVQNTKRK